REGGQPGGDQGGGWGGGPGAGGGRAGRGVGGRGNAEGDREGEGVVHGAIFARSVHPAVPATAPASRATRTMASRLRSTSASVVAQLETLMRIAVRPCHTVPPHQHVPSSWIPAITRRVVSGEPNDTSTWLSTTSFRTSKPAAESPSANRAAQWQQRSINSASPLRPRFLSAAQISTP